MNVEVGLLRVAKVIHVLGIVWSVNPHHLPGHAWVCIGVTGEPQAELCWATDQSGNRAGFMAFGAIQP